MMKEQITPLPILKRAPKALLKDLYLQPRDVAIIQAVYQYRALTRDQIERLFFGPDTPYYKASKYTRSTPYPEKTTATQRDTACKRRLALLFHHGYLFRDDQPQKLRDGRKPLVYFLDTQGAQLLAELAGIEPTAVDWHKRQNDVSWLFLNHLLQTNEIRLAVELAARKHGYQIQTWLDDRTLRQARREHVVIQVAYRDGKGVERIKEERVALLPDGYFCLQVGEKTIHYFVEADLGTVTGISQREGKRDFSRKVKTYLAYRMLGRFQARYGADQFRVLTVTTSEARLKTLLQATETAGGRMMFYFSTFDRIKQGDILADELWNQPTVPTRRRAL